MGKSRLKHMRVKKIGHPSRIITLISRAKVIEGEMVHFFVHRYQAEEFEHLIGKSVSQATVKLLEMGYTIDWIAGNQ